MKQLEELERKVLQVIQKNNELQNKNKALKSENEMLFKQNQELEATLMKENKSFESLEGEKATIKNSIEELIKSIGSLENQDKETNK